ncbi:MAG: hypothetical protein Kow0026_11440 [Oricola sp.]
MLRTLLTFPDSHMQLDKDIAQTLEHFKNEKTLWTVPGGVVTRCALG